ncbi:MAG: DUF2064 domain-containing protein [Alphaproteobacteria bacterium]|nr:DUF2064 domain-containing protein [Alphaproteobacteria bacterium]
MSRRRSIVSGSINTRSSTVTDRLVILAKAPAAGRSKTRLAAEIGAGRAAMVSRLLIDKTIDAARAGERSGWWRALLAVDPPLATGARWPGVKRGLATFGQARGDLGDRILSAMRDAAAGGPVVAIGADAPFVSAAAIRRAFLLLRSHDVVFGPAHDGGFWLIGVAGAQRLPRQFGAVRWSTADALADAQAAFAPGLRIARTDPLLDIDDRADLDAAGNLAVCVHASSAPLFERRAAPEVFVQADIIPITSAPGLSGRQRLQRILGRLRPATSPASAG